MSRTTDWLMDQHYRDVDLLAAEVAHLRDLVTVLRVACEAVWEDLSDDDSDAWVRPDVRKQVRAAINRAKGESK